MYMNVPKDTVIDQSQKKDSTGAPHRPPNLATRPGKAPELRKEGSACSRALPKRAGIP